MYKELTFTVSNFFIFNNFVIIILSMISLKNTQVTIFNRKFRKSPNKFLNSFK